MVSLRSHTNICIAVHAHFDRGGSQNLTIRGGSQNLQNRVGQGGVPNFPKQGRSGGGPKFEQSRNLMEFCVSLVVRGRTPSQGTTTPNINYHDGLISNNLCDYPNSDCLWHPWQVIWTTLLTWSSWSEHAAKETRSSRPGLTFWP